MRPLSCILWPIELSRTELTAGLSSVFWKRCKINFVLHQIQQESTIVSAILIQR